MASLTRSQLKTSSNNTYDTNGVGGITAAEARLFNNDLIDSLITNDLTSSMVVLSASFAATASYALNSTPLTSLNTFTASQDTKNLTLASYTGSNDTTNTTQNNRLTNLESKSASVDISITNINQFTASNGNTSLNQFTSSANNRLNSLEAATSSYAISSSVAAVDAAQQSQINSLIAASGSYLTASVSIPLTSLNSFTSSQYVSNSFFATTGSNTFNGDQTINGNVSINSIGNTTFDVGELKITGNNGSLKLDGASGATLRLNGTATSGMNDFDITTSPISNTGSVIFQNANNLFIFARFDSTDKTTIYNKLDVSGSVSITGSLTASLQQGYVWVGDNNNITKLVATSSFAGGGGTTDITSLNAFTASQETKNATLGSLTGSFATTGSNRFVGNQTLTGSLFISGNINMVNGADIITHHVRAAGSNGLELQNASSGIIVSMGAGGGTQASFTGAVTANSVSASSFTGLGNLTTYSTSVDSRLDSLEALTSSIIPLTSLNAFTASQDTKNTTLGNLTGSFATTGSNSFNGIQSISGSFNLTGSAYGNVVSMSINSNTASMDLSKGNYFELTSSASPLRIELSNVKAGLTSTLIISSSAATTISFSSNVGQPSPGAYSGSAAASTDILSFVAFNNSKANVVATKNIV